MGLLLYKYTLLNNVANSTPASSTTKTGRHDIAEILLKVALNTNKQSINQSKQTGVSVCLLQVLK